MLVNNNIINGLITQYEKAILTSPSVRHIYFLEASKAFHISVLYLPIAIDNSSGKTVSGALVGIMEEALMVLYSTEDPRMLLAIKPNSLLSLKCSAFKSSIIFLIAVFFKL